MRLLHVLPTAPLPFGDAAGRGYSATLAELVRRGHAVTALVACARPDEADEARSLLPGCDLRGFERPARRGLRGKVASLLRPHEYVFPPALRRELALLLAGRYDVLHLESQWAGRLGLAIPARSLLSVHYLAGIDLARARARGLRARLVRRLVLRAERRLVRAFPHVVTLTPELAAAVAALSPRARVDAIPLALDASRYALASGPCAPGPPIAGLVGSFTWEPTRSAAVRLVTRLWPRIRAALPTARLHLVGRGARAALAGLRLGPEVLLASDVPDAIPFLAGLDLLLYAPEAASGMKVKVLEALALGVPVVTNRDGVEGLPARDGVHAGLAEDDEGLIARALALLRDPAEGARRRAAGRALVEATCAPRAVVDALERVYARIAGGGGGS